MSSLSPQLKIAPVLKSNAYGHGISEVTQILDPLGAPFFCVDSLYEAYELLKLKVKTPILIMGYTNPQNLKVKKLPFSYAIYDLETAKALNEYQKDASVHIKVDTGMHRLGVPLAELPGFVEEVKKFTNIKVEGLMSHLAAAHNPEDKLFRTQIENFTRAKEVVQKIGVSLKWTHLSANEGLLNPKTRSIILQVSNLIRPGLAVYGICQSIDDPNLKPVLQLTSHLAQIKRIKKGDRVGYDGTFTAEKEMTIGILPLGYYDGVDRRLSNNGVVTVDGIQCPIIGRVSMNITTVDLSNIKEPYPNQEAVIYSANAQDANSIRKSADNCQTIAYDLLVHLATSTRRVII